MARGRPYRPWFIASINANQTTNLAVGNHIQFDFGFGQGGFITLATGSGQANGIFTLAAGYFYQLTCHVNCSSLTTGQATFLWQNHPENTTLAGVNGSSPTGVLVDAQASAGEDGVNQGEFSFIVDCRTAGKTIKLVKTGSSGTHSNWAAWSHVFIEALV